MPETTLHPEGRQRADTVVATPVAMTRRQALRQVGWIAGIDYTFMVMIAMCFITLLFWKIFGNPQPFNILACVLTACALIQVWIVVLIFRCSLFVLDLQATINLMPDHAARIVMSAYSGQPAPRR